MRTSVLAAFVAASLLTACGGGGSSMPSPPTLTNNNNGATPSPALAPQDVAQSGTTAAFGAVDTSEGDVAVSNGSLGTSSKLRSPQSVGFACRHRRTRTVTVNPDNTITVETIDYFDAACTQVERDAVAIHSVSNGTETVNRTVTTFNQAHLQLGVRKATYTLTGSTSNGSWTIVSSFFPGTSTTPLSQFSHAATLNASAYTASTGRIVNDAKPSINASFGHQVATTATVSSDASNDTTFSGARNGTFFKGALNALTLSSAPPFTVAGGTQIGTSALNGSVTFGPDGDLTNVALTGTLESGNSLVVTTTTSNGAISVNGTITSPTNAPVATFTTDEDGNGVLTLASGAQVPIVDWHVIWA